MGIGKQLRKLRKEENLTQAQLGKKLNLGESTISLYESNKREPDYKTLKKIADFFNVTADYLLGFSSKEEQKDKLKEIAPEKTLELLNPEEIDFLWEILHDDKRQILLRESRGLTDEDLAKAIAMIKAIVDEEREKRKGES
ncbi:hypothetical protein JCM16358_22780 [Halanaerocella petrolearia]